MSLYKSPQAQAAVFASYDRAMTLWPVAYEEDWIETDFGTTHLIISGPQDALPLFLLPGLFADATMWFANVGALGEHYRVYCLDHITYGGKSEPSGRRVANARDYAAWFAQVVSHYGYDRVAVAGLSYGSWLALALAREMPQAIAALVMLDPSETFMKMDGGIVWRGFWHFGFFPNRNKYRKFFDWMGGGFTSPQLEVWLEHMLDVIEYGSVGMFRVPRHRVYRAEELTMVTMPVLIVAGGKPILYKDPHAFASAAARALPHAEIEIVPQAGHGLNMEKPAVVNARVAAFLRENYR